MKRKFLTLSLLLLLGNLGRAADTKLDPTGTWQWAVPNPDGKIPKITCTLKLQGGTLTGTITRSTGTTTITNGIVKGDEVSFETPRHEASSPKGAMVFTSYHGKLNGDTIKGTATIYVNNNEFGSKIWELKRVKE